MTPNPCHRLPICVVLAVQLALAPEVRADTQASITGTPTAKGVVTCTLTTDHDPPPRWIQVWRSADGKDPDLVQVAPSARGYLTGPFPEQLGAIPRAYTTLPLVIASGDIVPEGFLFPQAGSYTLRFECEFKDGYAPVRTEVVVGVGPQKPENCAFLDDFGSEQTLEALGWTSVLSNLDEELRNRLPHDRTLWEHVITLPLIKTLFRQVALDIDDDLRVHYKNSDAVKLASGFEQLARAHQESDYAPYAAFVAARWYKTMVGHAPEAIADPSYARAMELIDMAIEKGDLFVVPRARLLKAILLWQVGKTAEARDALAKAIEAVGDTDSKLLARMQASVGKP